MNVFLGREHGAHNLLEQKKRLDFINTKYQLIYNTKWSVHSKSKLSYEQKRYEITKTCKVYCHYSATHDNVCLVLCLSRYIQHSRLASNIRITKTIETGKLAMNVEGCKHSDRK